MTDRARIMNRTSSIADRRAAPMRAFRSWRRGTREADLLLGTFADKSLAGFNGAQLDRLKALLDCPDVELPRPNDDIGARLGVNQNEASRRHCRATLYC